MSDKHPVHRGRRDPDGASSSSSLSSSSPPSWGQRLLPVLRAVALGVLGIVLVLGGLLAVAFGFLALTCSK
jgi:hypothetical protein